MSYIFFTGLWVLSFVCGSHALRCYECEYCGDVFNSSQASIKTCTGTCGKTKHEDNGYVVRFCNRVVTDTYCEWMDSATSHNSIATFAIQCYQCNFCGDQFQASLANIVNCSGSCEKGKRNDAVVRTCSPVYVKDYCKFRSTQRGLTRIHACACNTDLCNKGVSQNVNTMTLTFSGSILLISKLLS